MSMRIVCIMWTETTRIIMRFVRSRIDAYQKIWTSVDRPYVKKGKKKEKRKVVGGLGRREKKMGDWD